MGAFDTFSYAYVNEDGQVVLAMKRSEAGVPVLKALSRTESRSFALLILHSQGAEGMATAKAFVAGEITFVNPSPKAPPSVPLEGGTYRTPPTPVAPPKGA